MNTKQPSSKFPDRPTFDVVLEKLKTLLDEIQQAIAEGTLHVQEYANWQAEGIDAALAPNLVRHKAKGFLIALGQEAKDEEDEVDFETEHIPNNGICINVRGFKVRVLKSADDGSVPQPGLSETRRNFYSQLQAMLDFEELRNGNEHVQPTWGLIVHWTVDNDYNLLSLSVALPLCLSKSENDKLIVECAFDEPFWRRPPQPRVVPINEPLPQPSDLDIPAIEEETAEKVGGNGEEPKGE